MFAQKWKASSGCKLENSIFFSLTLETLIMKDILPVFTWSNVARPVNERKSKLHACWSDRDIRKI